MDEALISTAAKIPRFSKAVTRRTCSLMGVQIVDTGSYVPETVRTNLQMQEICPDCDPEWIEQRTGIRERRIVGANESTCDLAVAAAQQVMAKAGVYAKDIDLLIVGTFTPDYHCPSTACLVQDRLGLDAPAFDISAACSGFMYAVTTGAQYVATGNAKMALVIGADSNSRIVDQKDRTIAPLFGDGAGAVLLSAGTLQQGFKSYHLASDGSGAGMLDRPCGGSKNPITAEGIASRQHYLQMDGRNVFKWAVRTVVESIEVVLESAQLSVHDVSLFALHQANQRIIDSVADKLNVSRDRFYNNVHKYGNTSAASIPLVLDEANSEGKIDRGDTILMCGFGAGLTWGTSLFVW
ncbi:beta-ketoacyl-ACP synthase III [Rubinisphaera sp.]|uniref:beta-ketoacyl-ACP synthase III n=1 Tax=Rubinisphaera sp. TaxID=2024857 RepID=UPI000C0DBB17|nr:beta-ketoacyl-ACP synthase III [Rubinisphaera sp.]MBV10437.1 3-oxoacyl-ACP synthase [Rubinisphaera sp.]HCS55381.1 ketoacyl-ACP synthase III [Planctomycetaceae bacterium]